MKFIKLILFGYILCITSCNAKYTTIYFNDRSKVDDGEISATQASLFFQSNSNISIYKTKSSKITRVLSKIKESLDSIPTKKDLNDGFYDYAFITPAKDTFYADQKMLYWKCNIKEGPIKNPSIKKVILSTIKAEGLK